jgi:hypothetical protein
VEPTVYRICVRGRLSERFGSALEGMHLQIDSEFATFTGEICDQSQLYGLLNKVGDLGLELVRVQPYSATAAALSDHLDTRRGPADSYPAPDRQAEVPTPN